MNVYLDDRALRSQPTFAAALRAGVDEAARAGRVVVDAKVDGAAVEEAVLERPPETPIGEELRLTSVEPRALVRATLLDAAEALDKAVEDQRASADLIQSGKMEEAMAPLERAIGAWQAVREAVERSAGLVPLSPPGSAAGRLEELVPALTRHLEELKRCLRGQDWPALADVLAYDLSEEARRWTAMLRALSETLRAGE